MAKTKNIEYYCKFCQSVTKMERTAEIVSGDENKVWAKCKKCRQKMIVDLTQYEEAVRSKVPELDTATGITYSPMRSYNVGDSLFHEKLNDFGVVVSKETTSGGRSSIVVKFQNSGEKKLIETINPQ
ncbi:MAG: hypothetical protein HRU80_14440 [Ignavibacteriales bacterium]|nr:hypothetical protein [Ignavibacteriaceae bacterium]MCK6614890.1 hypothetical protein [Ignavibacteriaceae bacterium]QOJ29999.1 MAG: hypothetical protein HRU80_14440 [Ignavibacteriales bacterium]